MTRLTDDAFSQLFNNYADQAGYYDLCLLIYHTADYRNPTTIAGTWSNLIQTTHDDIVSAMEDSNQTSPPPAWPYEAVTNKVKALLTEPLWTASFFQSRHYSQSCADIQLPSNKTTRLAPTLLGRSDYF